MQRKLASVAAAMAGGGAVVKARLRACCSMVSMMLWLPQMAAPEVPNALPNVMMCAVTAEGEHCVCAKVPCP